MADVIEITAEVRERELRLTSIHMMPSGSRNHLRIRVTFDAEWDGTTKTLVAYRDLSKPYHVPLGLDGMALIPHEVLAEQGVAYLGVFGVAGDQRITSTIVRYGVNEGAVTEGLQPSDPTPEMWDQLISAVNEVRQAAESAMRDAQTAAQGAQRSEQAAAGSATQADGAATRAETAADTATTSAQDAETAKTDAQTAQRAADQSAADAQKSATRAEQAAGNLSTAVTQAEDAAQAAQQSATQAQGHAKSAGDSAASAEQAQQGATDAETAARQSAAQAQKSQETATQAATEAGKSARQADTAKTAAQNSATVAGQQANAAATSAQQAQQSQIAAAGSATSAQAGAAEATKQAAASEASAARAENAANEVEQSAQQIAGAIDRLAIHETADGNPAVIRDGADWQMEGLRVYGQSEQVTTTGAQMFDASKCTVGQNAYGLDITMDGYRVTIKGTSTRVHTDTSFAIMQYADTSLSGKGYKIKAFNAVGTAIKKIYGLRTTDEKDIAIVIDTSRNTNVNMSFDIMVSETDATAFEPYTGGKPAPSPEYPQEIMSKTVDQIVVTGANLLDCSTTKSNVGNVDIRFDGSILLVKNKNTYAAIVDIPITLNAGTYYMSVLSTTVAVPVYVANKWFANGVSSSVKRATIKIAESGVYNARITVGAQSTATVDGLMISAIDAPYEPYHAQTVKLSTPVTLRGVPVNTGGNVTINGQQYVADLITEREGVVGVEWRTAMIDQYAGESVGEPYISTTGALTTGASVVHTIPAEFSPLPEPDQQAIRSLRTYHGNTVVTAGAHTEVDYIADPKLYIDGKVNALVTAYMQSIPVTIPLLDEEVVQYEE